MRGWAPFLFALALAAPAAADLYKCEGPGGRTLYTSDRSQCPGAPVHEPQGSVQDGGGGGASAQPRDRARATRRAMPAAQRAANEEAQARAWRQRKLESERSLREVRGRIQYVQNAVRACNRGIELYTEDTATGLRSEYSCKAVKAEFAELQAEEERLAAYVAGGWKKSVGARAACRVGFARRRRD